jgi:putative ABC transport system permease protein
MNQIRQDLAYAWRLFRRSPWFYAGAALTLAAGIGANGAVFTVLRAVLLQPLPYSNPDRLVMVWRPRAQQPAATRDMLRPVFARPAPGGRLAYRVHHDAADLLESATYKSWQGNLEAQFDIRLEDRAERLRGALVTANFFDVLGTPAALGRPITASDETANPTAIVLSDGLWRRAYGADRGIIGRPITLLAERGRVPTVFTVVGVMPREFDFTYPESTEAWAILPWPRVDSPTTGFWTVARLRPGVTRETAQARLAGLPASVEPPDLPPQYRDTIRLEPVTEWVTSESRPSLLLLGGVAVLLLLIACSTVASALFVRVTERQRELALRSAIGAGSDRLLRQLLTEGALLSTLSAIGGSALAWLVAPVLRALVPASVPRAGEIAVDLWILGFFGATATLTTILATLAPAWRGMRVDVVNSLKQSGGATTDRSAARWRQGLIGAQSALAAAMLVLAALLIASFWRLSGMPLGYQGDGVLTVEMRLLAIKYRPIRLNPGVPGPPVTSPSPVLMDFQERLLTRVRTLPGIAEAGITSAVPFRGVDFTLVLERTGTNRSVSGNGRYVDEGFFGVLRVPLVRGRLFTDADTLGTPRVMVISESYARKMFGNEDAVGQSTHGGNGPTTVIGVVADLRYRSFDEEPFPAIYFPIRQAPVELMCLVARLQPDARNVEASVRAIVRELDPDLPAMHMTTIDRILATSVSDRRFYTVATTSLAALALFLTVVGLVVVVSRAVVERQRELAIRVALGAKPSRIITGVMRQGVGPVVLGTLAGLSVVWLGSRFVEQFLFQTAPRDWWIHALVFAVIVATAVAAAFVPSRRATRVSAATVLKGE